MSYPRNVAGVCRPDKPGRSTPIPICRQRKGRRAYVYTQHLLHFRRIDSVAERLRGSPDGTHSRSGARRYLRGIQLSTPSHRVYRAVKPRARELKPCPNRPGHAARLKFSLAVIREERHAVVVVDTNVSSDGVSPEEGQCILGVALRCTGADGASHRRPNPPVRGRIYGSDGIAGETLASPNLLT